MTYFVCQHKIVDTSWIQRTLFSVDDARKQLTDYNNYVNEYFIQVYTLKNATLILYYLKTHKSLTDTLWNNTYSH